MEVNWQKLAAYSKPNKGTTERMIDSLVERGVFDE